MYYKNVVTIIGSKETMPFTVQELNSVVDILQANGAIIEDVKWLAEDEACDIFFAVLSQEEVYILLSQLFMETKLPFDFVVQNNGGRKKKLILSDMDSTIIEQECIDEIADFAGLKEKISTITERAMNGELDFKEALRERVKMLEGLAETVLSEAFDSKITIMPGAKELVQTMKAHGAKAVLVSGGFTFFTQKVAQMVGFDVEEANILNIADGKLDGTVKEPILDSSAKLNALHFYAEDMGVGLSQTLVVGDGANDLPMILACSDNGGLGIAYHSKPRVAQQAKHKIDNCNLIGLLYAQGYSSSDIVLS